jgi:hypothetical protein
MVSAVGTHFLKPKNLLILIPMWLPIHKDAARPERQE